jgi:hypothetical protein
MITGPREKSEMSSTSTRQITVHVSDAFAQAVMRAAYDELGADSEESDVEPFLPAQSEVVRHDPA